MERKNDPATGNYGRRSVRRAAILILTGYSLLSALILLIFGKLPPAPLAEFEAFSYAYSVRGDIFPAAAILLVYFAAAALCIMTAFERFDTRAVKIAAAVLILADLAVHAYVFLAADGYQWNYLISAALDAALAICVIYKERRREAAEKGGTEQ